MKKSKCFLKWCGVVWKPRLLSCASAQVLSLRVVQSYELQVKCKEIHEQAHRLRDSWYKKVVMLSDLCTDHLISVRSWVKPRAIVQPEGLCQRKILVTPSGIEHMTFWLVVQYVNQQHHCVPLWLTLRRLMSYIYGAPILDVSRSHTTTQHSR